MSNEEIEMHKRLAETMGRACAARRAEYYAKVKDASIEQATRLARIHLVYLDRASEAEADGDDCE